MRSPLSLGTISPPADVSRTVSALLSEEQEDKSDGATRAEAPPIAMVFRKSLRSAIVVLVFIVILELSDKYIIIYRYKCCLVNLKFKNMIRIIKKS